MAAIGIRPGAAEENREFRWTVDKLRFVESTGFFAPDEEYELLDGRLLRKMGQTNAHAALLAILAKALERSFGTDAYAQWNHPIHLSDDSEPEPDIAIIRGDPEDLGARKAGPDDIVLAVEVCFTTHTLDFGDKKRAYSRHRIPEYWIVDLDAERLHVLTLPDGEGGWGNETVIEDGAIPRLDRDLRPLLKKVKGEA